MLKASAGSSGFAAPSVVPNPRGCWSPQPYLNRCSRNLRDAK